MEGVVESKGTPTSIISHCRDILGAHATGVESDIIREDGLIKDFD